MHVVCIWLLAFSLAFSRSVCVCVSMCVCVCVCVWYGTVWYTTRGAVSSVRVRDPPPSLPSGPT